MVSLHVCVAVTIPGSLYSDPSVLLKIWCFKVKDLKTNVECLIYSLKCRSAHWILTTKTTRGSWHFLTALNHLVMCSFHVVNLRLYSFGEFTFWDCSIKVICILKACLAKPVNTRNWSNPIYTTKCCRIATSPQWQYRERHWWGPQALLVKMFTSKVWWVETWTMGVCCSGVDPVSLSESCWFDSPGLHVEVG